MARNYFVTGITDLLVLSILKKQDSYAYEISKTIQQQSQGLLSISHATIYPAIYKLENDGYISEYSQTVGKRRVRVYYHLEKKGLDYLKDLLTAYQQVNQGVNSVLQFLDQ